MSENVFNAYSGYYDLLYRDKDYAGEAAYIVRLLKQHGINHGSLLEFGSGTGKHGRLLAELGYQVHGVERSEEMVALTEQGNGFTCESGDICNVQVGRTFDAVLSLFHVISYQTTNASLNAVFARAAEHLEPGGIFIFDFWYSPAVYAQQPSVRVKRLVDENVEIVRIAEPEIHTNENRVDVHYTIFATDPLTGRVQTLKEKHPMRHFSLPELDLLAETHGFARVGTEEFMTGNKPGESTWGVCITLKRI
ncbi:class I SAM-dependent DNA methyltransferase [Endozoicomonas ascidiicola]|uniref:class I SAM-dependent DNA methyltransferase n=1 Tax=Endozoicomonas ascidiicola TaxID=1698521 RepID=UPI000B087D85|nr:class I SAM-dependent methyltransferase [Endozoicomonas ascidiicola]